MNAFAAARIPVVVIDADISGIDTYDLVSMDNAKAAYNLTAALLASGRRHPRFVTFRDYASGVANRIAGFQRALGRMDASDIWILDEDRFERELAARLAADDEVDSLVCHNDVLAIGSRRAIRASGYFSQDTIALAGFDGLAFAGSGEERCLTIDEPVKEIAETALELAERRVREPRAVFKSELVRAVGEW